MYDNVRLSTPSALFALADRCAQMSIERIQILIRKNYEEMGQLHEQLALIQSGHDEDNDPELIDEKLWVSKNLCQLHPTESIQATTCRP